MVIRRLFLRCAETGRAENSPPCSNLVLRTSDRRHRHRDLAVPTPLLETLLRLSPSGASRSDQLHDSNRRRYLVSAEWWPSASR
jgi:hypothetical protein